MVIGNSNQPSASLLSPASTLASKLVNEFNEASGDQLAALMYIALVLFGITIIVKCAGARSHLENHAARRARLKLRCEYSHFQKP